VESVTIPYFTFWWEGMFLPHVKRTTQNEQSKKEIEQNSAGHYKKSLPALLDLNPMAGEAASFVRHPSIVNHS
jgi:hypothetical protein